VLALVATVVLVGSGAGVAALAQPDAGDVYTGCLNENSGVLHKVAVGFEPAMPCNEAESQVTWDRAGPAFEGRIAALEERVAERTVAAPSPVELFAAVTVDVTFDDSGVSPRIETSVGPIDSVTLVGTAHYRVNFGEVVFDGFDTTAFISLATNTMDDSDHCTYAISDEDKLDIYCWQGGTSNQPEWAEWSLMVFAVPTP
jgi:hypothetical protein